MRKHHRTRLSVVTDAAAETVPSTTDLAAIEVEWPLIEAEMNLLDAEIRVLTMDHPPAPIDWQRLRKAQARVLRTAAKVSNTRPTDVRAA